MPPDLRVGPDADGGGVMDCRLPTSVGLVLQIQELCFCKYSTQSMYTSRGMPCLGAT